MIIKYNCFYFYQLTKNKLFQKLAQAVIQEDILMEVITVFVNKDLLQLQILFVKVVELAKHVLPAIILAKHVKIQHHPVLFK